MKRDYSDPLYKEWRQKIYKRDHFQCQWPNCKVKTKLQAHHIRTWADYPGLRYHPDNGITLCKNHHSMIRGQEDVYAAIFLKLLASKK
jgi:5-methylcytosine-specific restriction endonuclease McrA